MTIRLTVILHIILGVFFGIVLAVLPWASTPLGLGDWGDNYFLLQVAHKLNFDSLQTVIASGWVRGAVTGLGLLSLATALWDATHFNRTVRELEYDAVRVERTNSRAHAPADLSDNERTPDR